MDNVVGEGVEVIDSVSSGRWRAGVVGKYQGREVLVAEPPSYRR